jgi:hypothetical protein
MELNVLRDLISLWIDNGTTLAKVEEELIEPAQLGEDERAALWLFAWSYAKRRQDSRRAVEVVA